MSCARKDCSHARAVVRRLTALLLACTALLLAPAAFAVDSGDIIVVNSKGEVHITVKGAERKVRAGGVLELPASVHTGSDGSVELRQGATTVSVGPESLLEFPALEKPGAPIDRIVQPQGNVFYNIGKREGRKLRVETPYLVGVIKGTQFNVAAERDATTISLFEGLLEVRAADDSDVVDLKAGEIASRRNGDKSISMIKMDAGKAPAPGPRSSPPSGSNNGAPDATVPREGDDSLVRADIDFGNDIRLIAPPAGTGTAVTGDVSTGVNVDAGPATADLGTSTPVDPGAGAIDTTASTSIDAGPLTTGVAADVTVDLPSGSDVDVGVDLGVDDGNNGHGNDESGTDPSNPGNGSGNHGRGNADAAIVLDGLLRRSGRK
jgi:hypothetical protein